MAVNQHFRIFATEKEQKKGTGVFPSSFVSTMSRENQIETVQKLLQPLLADDIFLVDIKIKPINNIKIFLDADSGLGIEKCIKINRTLYKVMEEMAIYPDGDFSLEVSSPGIDEPLKMHRQYVKNIGREIEVTMNDDRKHIGKLISVNDDQLEIEYTEGKNKKAVVIQLPIAFTDIKQVIVQIKF